MNRKSLQIVLLTCLAVGIFLWGIEEAGYGLTQLLGWRHSRHMAFAMTGHFINPGPFGGFIACVMAVAGAWLLKTPVLPKPVRLGTRLLAGAALAMGMLVLPVSLSRTGWLALGVALGAEALRLPRVRVWVRRHQKVIPISIGLVLVLLVGAFLLKPDSAIGRLHIWRMECRAIAERPLTGAGPGMFAWAYGEAQEAFFRESLETVSPTVVRVAGCPEFAFNEYLGAGVEYGLPGLLLAVVLVVAALVVLYRRNSPFAAGLTAWALFAFASYPLSEPRSRILGGVLILAAVVAGVLGHRKLHFSGFLPLLAAVLLAGWVGIRGVPGRTDRHEAEILYRQGYALHQEGRFAESSVVLERGALMSCDPMFEVILGRNAEALGEVDKAEALYEKAHYMVPSRLYPLVRQMRLQIRQGRDKDALRTARQIALMPVNDRHAGMVRLREESMATLDSLQAVTGSPAGHAGAALR